LTAYFTSSLFTKKLIIKYLTETKDYKHYCDLGNKNIIAKPLVCPLCKGTDCLIGHGWYLRKGLSGATCNFLPFWIKRFYCKVTRKTISMHPRFSHTRKRYVLPFVIDCFVRMLENAVRQAHVAQELHIPRQTLKRWVNSFCCNDTETKWICFRLTGPPQSCLGMQLLSHFRKIEQATLYDNVASGMVCLLEHFYISLY
jgi:transposase-like protein